MRATAAIAAGGCLAAIAQNTAGAMVPNAHWAMVRERFHAMQADMDRIAAGKRPITACRPGECCGKPATCRFWKSRGRHATAADVAAYLAGQRGSVRA